MVTDEAMSIVRDPVPVTYITRRAAPVNFSSVPPAPEPAPRRTTPLAVMRRTPPSWKVPAFSTTAPRKPSASGLPPTMSMAPWMAAVSSLPDGPSVTAAGTSGSGTPPPR